MRHYTNIEIKVGNNIEIIVKNDGILQYLKNILSQNFKFEYTEIKNSDNTILSISPEDVSYDVFKRHFEVIYESHLEKHKI